MTSRSKTEVTSSEAGPAYAGHVGFVALACFLVGAGLPALLGVDLAPRPPGLSTASAPKAPTSPPEAEIKPGDPAAAKSAPRSPPLRRQRVEVHGFTVTSCGTGKSWQESPCDRPAMDGGLETAIVELSTCDGSAGATGVLSLGVQLDFARGHVTAVRPGRSTTFSATRTRELLACADDVVVGTPLPSPPRQPAHGRYWAYYRVQFASPDNSQDESGKAAPPIATMSGHATVSFDRAALRAEPSDDAPVRSQLLYGTRVKVTARTGRWYRVELAGMQPGWLDREALGL